MKDNLLPLEPKFKRRAFVRLVTEKMCVPKMLVASYVAGDNGKTICKAVPESQIARCDYDGQAYEIANLMYAKVPEDLGQINMSDPMTAAERITTHCVRRFGSLEKQRQSLIEKLNSQKKVEE